MMKTSLFFFVSLFCFLSSTAQVRDSLAIFDTVSPAAKPAIRPDTVVKHNPRKATIRSAILPGWGQATNRKYWKIPIVYAAIGIPVGTFLYNKKWYGLTRDVAKMISTGDTANYRNKVDSRFYVFFEFPNNVSALTNYRNKFRQNMDYSLLFVLLFWGLNVVDATVDAHLRDFDVGENLSLRLQPAILGGGSAPGLSLLFTWGKHPPKNVISGW